MIQALEGKDGDEGMRIVKCNSKYVGTSGGKRGYKVRTRSRKLGSSGGCCGEGGRCIGGQ